VNVAPYEPPVQSKRGQLLDAATVLVLIFATLFATTFLVQEATTDVPTAAENRQLADLPLTAVERAQFQKLIDSGTTDLPAVVAAVDANQAGTDKYDISVAALLGTAILLAVYLAFVYRTSFREYREVIEEKFGPRDGGGSA
jgi:heme/copper-type cytochrome/quinol oxidase subunit 3